jgi:hypothetical protein
VLLDSDLADVYGVTTKRLNEQVKRNLARFPGEFLFRLTDDEKREVVAKCDHLGQLKYAKTRPWAFTEHGAIMAATVLKTPQAVAMSVYVVRTFVRMRDRLAANAALIARIAEIDQSLLQHDEELQEIWHRLQPLMNPPLDPHPRRIGFHSQQRA